MGKMLKTFGIYFMGNVFSRLISFAMLALLTRYIEPEGMGYFETANGMINVFMALISIQIWAGILRYLIDFHDNRRRKRQVIATGYSVEIVMLLLFTIGFWVVNLFANIRDAGFIYFCAISYVFFQNVAFTARGLGQNKLYVISGVIGSIASALCNLFCVLVLHWGSQAIMLSMALSYFVPAVFMELFLKTLKKVRLRDINFKLLKVMLVYCVPLAINQGVYWINTRANTVIITQNLGADQTGIYSASFKLTSLILLVVTMFNLAWQEYTFAISHDRDRSKKYNIVLDDFIRFIGCGMLMLLPVTNVLFDLMIGPKYAAGKVIIPLAYLGTVVDSLANFIGSIMCAENKMKSMLYSMIVGAVITVGFMELTIHTIGLQSANIAMILCFLAVIVIRTLSVRRIVKLKYNYKFLLPYLVVYVIASYVFQNFGPLVNFIFAFAVAGYCLFVLRDIIKDFLVMAKKKIGKAE